MTWGTSGPPLTVSIDGDGIFHAAGVLPDGHVYTAFAVDLNHLRARVHHDLVEKGFDTYTLVFTSGSVF